MTRKQFLAFVDENLNGLNAVRMGYEKSRFPSLPYFKPTTVKLEKTKGLYSITINDYHVRSMYVIVRFETNLDALYVSFMRWYRDNLIAMGEFISDI